MNLAEAPVNIISAKITAITTPSDRLTLEVSGTNITLPASDVARLVIDHLVRSTRHGAEPSAVHAAESMTDTPHRIGALWVAHGGIYAGTVRGDQGKPDHHLIVAVAEPGELAWKDAMEWAASLPRPMDGIDLHPGDFTLPDRKEQAVLYGNVPELFEKAWYWSRESRAGSPEYAWYQYFYYGFQTSTRKDFKLRARAVRRVPIQ